MVSRSSWIFLLPSITLLEGIYIYVLHFKHNLYVINSFYSFYLLFLRWKVFSVIYNKWINELCILFKLRLLKEMIEIEHFVHNSLVTTYKIT